MKNYGEYQIVPTHAAMEIGMVPAMILKYIANWVVHNKRFQINYHDGKYWTYDSLPSYQKVFPYLTMYQLKSAFSLLKNEGYIESANYNKMKRDRTNWYTITQKAEKILGLDTEENEHQKAQWGVETDKRIGRKPTDALVENQPMLPITYNNNHQQPDFFDDTQDLDQPPTALQTSDHCQPFQKKNFKKSINCDGGSSRAISSSTTVGCSNKESKNFEVSATEDELSAKQPSKSFLKNIITEIESDIIEFYKAVFGEISVRETIALGYLTKTYGIERLLEALNRANCIAEGEIKNPTAYLMTTIQRSIELEKIKRD